MSLINDALKKAQHLQARKAAGLPVGDAAARLRVRAPAPLPHTQVPPADTPAAVAASGSMTTPDRTLTFSADVPALESDHLFAPASPRLRRDRRPALILALGGGMLALALTVLGASFLVVRDRPANADPSTTVASAPVAEQPAADEPPQPALSAAQAAIPAGPLPVSAPIEPAPAVPAVSAAPVAQAPTPDQPAFTAPAAVASVEPPVPVPSGPDKAVARAWIDKIQLSGIRTGNQPKVLMNDRVFTIGDTVNSDLGLVLTAVDSRFLTFEDAAGNPFELRF